MAKILQGTIISTKTQNTAIVAVSRRAAHPLYKKLVKITKKFKVDTGGKTVSVGDVVRIVETRPLSKDKHFRILEEKPTKS